MNTVEFNEGHKAYTEGLEQSANPYYFIGASTILEIQKSWDWLNGWNTAYFEGEIAKLNTTLSIT